MTPNPYAGYHYPAEVISHAVWLCFRFTLSDRDVEELLAARGLIVTDETVRQWCLKFGQDFANELRRRAPRRGDKWHLDEVYLSINGRRYSLWRAVDQDGCMLDILVQPCRDRRETTIFVRQVDNTFIFHGAKPIECPDYPGVGVEPGRQATDEHATAPRQGIVVRQLEPIRYGSTMPASSASSNGPAKNAS